MGPNEKLWHSKGHHKQNEKMTLRSGLRKYLQMKHHGINVYNIQIAHAVQYQNKKELNQKMGGRSK